MFPVEKQQKSTGSRKKLSSVHRKVKALLSLPRNKP